MRIATTARRGLEVAAAELALRRRGEVGLARAVASAYRTGLHGPERQWGERIEEVRAELEQRSDTLDDDGQSVGQVTRRASKQRRAAQMLMRIVSEERPASVVEMGTCVGISGAYIAAALRLSGRGRLITLEGSPERASVASEVLTRLGLDDLVEVRVGRFADTLAMALTDAAPVNFLFVDGHHEEKPTVDYYRMVTDHLAPRALVLRDPNQADEPDPAVVTNRYDAQGRVDRQTDELGRATTLDYTSIAGATAVTDPEGDVTVEYYLTSAECRQIRPVADLFVLVTGLWSRPGAENV